MKPCISKDRGRGLKKYTPSLIAVSYTHLYLWIRKLAVFGGDFDVRTSLLQPDEVQSRLKNERKTGQFSAHFWVLKVTTGQKSGLEIGDFGRYGRNFVTCTDDFGQFFGHLPTF